MELLTKVKQFNVEWKIRFCAFFIKTYCADEYKKSERKQQNASKTKTLPLRFYISTSMGTCFELVPICV